MVTNLRNNTAYFFAVSSVAEGFESADTARLRAVPSAPVLDLLPAGAKIEKLASGFAATEGPVWDPAGGYLIFSDQLNNRLLRWTPGSGITIYRQPSNVANGNALDLQGRLITCEPATRSVTRTEMDGTVTPLVTQYKGKTFNEPNDVWKDLSREPRGRSRESGIGRVQWSGHRDIGNHFLDEQFAFHAPGAVSANPGVSMTELRHAAHPRHLLRRPGHGDRLALGTEYDSFAEVMRSVLGKFFQFE